MYDNFLMFKGSNIKPQNALSHVMGLTVANDITARDIQKRHNQWFKGKSLDGCCPLGPCIVPLDTMGDLSLDNLSLKLWVNGELRQSGNTRDMIFKIPEIISQLSEGFTLLPVSISQSLLSHHITSIINHQFLQSKTVFTNVVTIISYFMLLLLLTMRHIIQSTYIINTSTH